MATRCESAVDCDVQAKHMDKLAAFSYTICLRLGLKQIDSCIIFMMFRTPERLEINKKKSAFLLKTNIRYSTNTNYYGWQITPIYPLQTVCMHII